MAAITPIVPDKKESRRRCPRCGNYFQHRMPRGVLAKYVLFFLPLSKHFCGSCLKSSYVWGRK